MAVTLIPAAASAETAGVPSGTGQEYEAIKEIGEQIQDPANDPFAFTVENESEENYPKSYDLRDKGIVTPVKFQNPFGTCWGFAAIAAAETSILGSKDPKVVGDYTKDTLDLSEKHLVYFVNKAISDRSNSQYGEGIHANKGTSLADQLNSGGMTFMATNLFASGLGPVVEDDGDEHPTLKYMGEDRSKEFRMVDGVMTEYCYDDEDDWTLPEEYRFLHTFQLKESYMLPSPAKADHEAGTYTYDPDGTKAIKDMLMNNRAVQIGFCADTSSPSQEAGDGIYISKNWAHYTYDAQETPNHAVTIVGWNDDYPAENFVQGHEPKDEKGNLLNGAWLVKNSWGSEEEQFPNRGPGWGLENDEGEHTGYFWLSYYDKSLDSPEALEFDRNNESENEADYVDAYDYMPPNDVEGAAVDEKTRMANVFKASECELLEAVSCQTSYPGTKVVSQIYLLPNGFKYPTDGLLVGTVQGEYQYGGFHKMKLESPVQIQKGQYYSVVQTQNTPDGQYAVNMPIGLGQAFSAAMGYNTWVEGVVNKKESYIFSGGKWYDYSDKSFRETMFGDFYQLLSFDNFPIKGYCGMQPDVRMQVDGETKLDLNEMPESVLRVSFKGHDAAAVKPEIEWKLSDKGSSIFTVTPDPKNPFRATVKANKIGTANLYVTVKGAGTTVVPLSVKKKELYGYMVYNTDFVYNGKTRKPRFEIYDEREEVVPSKHYTVEYKNNKKCGIAKATVKAKASDETYMGSQIFEFYIYPAKAKILKMEAGKKKLTITVKNQKSSGVKSYEVKYRVKGTSKWKTQKFKAKTNKLVLKNLKPGKAYQVKVRAREAYHKALYMDIVGKFSKVKTSAKIKKS